ncbi:riboflavin kinase [Plasmodiophora brassicae]|uniref:riboflavin kinase n=1 Tax=Plasmodiophora brassicae TaxID=37360 RepID=A0A0G4IZA3_PLABS|nr:hypothetical protein PBRA_001717 [Plasmodiophora brassicae]SPQ93850.1 unnamed protein product [Plasmodiophora brassicae]
MDHDGIVRVCTACRPVWRLRGAVVRGQARGRDLGFPTANLGEAAWAGQSRLPRHGVYIGWAAISSRPGVAYKAMVSVGDNPSFGSDNSVTIEAYLCNEFSKDFYGDTMSLLIVARIRDMMRISFDQLVRAIRNDTAFGTMALDQPEFAQLRDDPWLFGMNDQ